MTYEVLAVRYGTRMTRRAETYLNYHVYGEPDAELRMDYFFWVVRNADRTPDRSFMPISVDVAGLTLH